MKSSERIIKKYKHIIIISLIVLTVIGVYKSIENSVRVDTNIEIKAGKKVKIPLIAAENAIEQVIIEKIIKGKEIYTLDISESKQTLLKAMKSYEKCVIENKKNECKKAEKVLKSEYFQKNIKKALTTH